MTVSKRKGDPGKADELFKRIIHARGSSDPISHNGPCERCGVPGTDTAHIIGRSSSATRCIEDNAWLLCRTCHNLVDNWLHHKLDMIERTIGMERYHELVALADSYRSLPVSATVFWREEVERLKARCDEMGVSTRPRRAA